MEINNGNNGESDGSSNRTPLNKESNQQIDPDGEEAQKNVGKNQKKLEGLIGSPAKNDATTPSYNPIDSPTKLQRKKSSYYDFDKIEAEAKSLRTGDKANEELRKNLMFGEKDIGFFQLYCHLAGNLEVFCMILGTIGSVGAGVAMPIMAYLSCDVFSDMGNTSEQQMTPQAIEYMKAQVEDIMNTQINRFLYIGAIMFVCNFLSAGLWAFIGARMVYTLKKRYFKAMLSQEQGWFDQNNPFEFATKVQSQMEQVEMGVGDKVGTVIQSVSQCIVGFVIAFICSWKLTLIMLCVAPLILIDMGFLVTSMKTGIVMSRKTYEKAGGIAEEMLYNIKTVASFANFEYEKSRFNEKIEVVYQLDKGTMLRLGACIGVLIFLLNCAVFVAFIYGRTLIKREYNSNKGKVFRAGDVMTVTFCNLMAIMGIGLVAPNIKMIQESLIATSDYFNLIEREVKIDLTNSTYKPPREDVKGRIEFKKVQFYYPSDPSKRLILNDLDLVFESGKKVALVGESGCGKSTTVNLIERLYEATGGEILIDGHNIKEYDLKYIRSLIGYVQQEPVLFNTPIKDNLIFGREDIIKELGDTEQLIKDACDQAFATEFINNLKGGINYIAGIKGGKLSGGQKQRIAIARAILCKPKILILDEATSALDNKSEKEVQRALDNISCDNVTTIIIAHRLSTIKNADLIYAIKDGKVLEQGTHKELLAKKGYYAGLVKSQLAQDEIEEKNQLEEMERRKSSIQRKNTEDELHFEDKEDEIYIKEDTVKLQPCRIFAELKDYKIYMIFGTLGAAIVGFLQPITGLVNTYALNAMNSKYIKIRYQDGLKYSLIMLAIALAQGIGNFLMIWQYQTLGVTLAKIFRKKVLTKYLEYHLSFYDITDNAPGALLTRLSIDTTSLGSLVNSILGTSTQVVTTLILTLILGCYYEYRLCLINICFVPFQVMAIFLRRGLNQGSSKRGVKSNIEAGAHLSECVCNTKTIYSFNFQDKALEIYLNTLEFVRSHFTSDAFLTGFLIGLGIFAMFCGNACVFYAAKTYILNGDIDSETMAFAMNIVMTGGGGIGNAISQLGDLKKAFVAFKSVYSTLDNDSLIKPFYNDNLDKVDATKIKGKIELKNVSFAYPTRPDSIILKNVTLTIEPGQNVALVGYSGSGKSTVISLLLRFYDVEDDKGEILIDGVNIKNYNLYQLRKKIGYVQQEPVLFKRSVLENVRYGNLEATDEQCVEAARKANIMKFFEGNKMHQMLDVPNPAEEQRRKSLSGRKSSVLSEGEGKKESGKKVGSKVDPVSGGEKQRLAIARAFLKDPAILLLDEATSALDKDSELEVQKSIDNLAGGRTTVSIAHRLSTIENCDKIFVLENGRLVEEGTHKELMALKNKYYTLHKYSDAA